MTSTSPDVLPRGSLVALITPFKKDGSIDWEAFRRLIDWHIESGTQGLVVAGTTGESSTLSTSEHIELLSVAASHAAGRIHVMAGVGANSTSEAIHLSKMAQEVGVQSLLSVVPYYNKPTQEGLYRHFSMQADASSLPLVLYSVAGRTVVDFDIATLERLSHHKNIHGIKDASGDLIRAQNISKVLDPNFVKYSGDDLTVAPYLAMGGHGIISVTANILPGAVQFQCEAIFEGRLREFSTRIEELFAVSQTLFHEANPIPVKYLAAKMNLCQNVLREPLVPPSKSTSDILDRIYEQSPLFKNTRNLFST